MAEATKRREPRDDGKLLGRLEKIIGINQSVDVINERESFDACMLMKS